MLPNSILFIIAGAISVTIANRTPAGTAGYVCLMGLAIVAVIAIAAEWIFHRRGARFWCAWAFAGGIAGAVLCLLNLLLFRKVGVDPLFWIAAGVALICLLFPLRYRDLQMIRGVFVPVALLNGFLLLWLCVLMAANIPWFYPEPSVPETPPRTPQQVKDMDEFIRLLPKRTDLNATGEIDENALIEAESAVKAKLRDKVIPSEMKGVDLSPIAEDLARVEHDLDRLWNFLAEHQPVFQGGPNTPIPSFLAMRMAVLLESLAIQLDAQQGRDFRPRLQRFFRGTHNWIGIDIGNVSTMVGNAYFIVCADSLIPLADRLNEPDLELLELLRANRNAVMPAFRRSFQCESGYMDDVINYIDWDRDNTERFMRLLTLEAFDVESLASMKKLLDPRRRHWPFYNRRDTMRRLSESLRADLEVIDAPDFQARWNLLQKRDTDLERDLAESSHIVNPSGRRVLALRSFWSRTFLRTAVTEARLAALEQLLINKWNISAPPVANPLTGKPFEIATDGSIRMTAGVREDEVERLREVYPTLDQPISLY